MNNVLINAIKLKYKTPIIILGIFVLSRLLIFSLGYLTWQNDNSTLSLDMIFCRHDCGWYMRIIQDGYKFYPHEHPNGDAANWEFFPLFPILTRLLGDFFSINYIRAGFVLSNMTFLGSLFVLYNYCKKFCDHKSSIFAVIFLAFSPYSVYFSVPYTEALFLFLMVITFYFASIGKWVLSGISAALLSSTRVVGVTVIIPMLIMAMNQYGLKNLLLSKNNSENAILGILMAPAGLFTFMLYLYHHIGDAFAFKNVEISWDREVGNFIIILINGFSELSNINFYFSLISIVGIILSLYLIIQKKLPEASVLILGILIPLTTGLWSMPRYIFALFPVYIAISLATKKSILFRYVTLTICIVSFVFITKCWTRGDIFVQ